MKSINDHNPIAHFQKWFYEVDTNYPAQETNAMLLSTIGLDGFPKSRIVLLKRFTWEGFIFFTNYNSEKGKAIETNNNVSIYFNWALSKREVLISGKAEKIPENLSEGYFDSRPEGSKLSAWVSHQSEVISSRNILENRLKAYEIKFKNKTIPKPQYWGGYIIKPCIIEFIEQDPQIGCNCTTKFKLQSDYNWSKEIRYTKAP
ncbi:pyridoxamine 5'-phosphate oxidase [Aquimarina sp. RZ0]|uniref:pyridoxamine 5'-phosphate oxidase n=1 Tax=Aquimarina sp. RZ0 TaxID=2607730 RepID=UPI0011F2113C|nr:pyridoxamine 5'-phosphate oxidase [Aquimarina sp. RZ0]KAA1247384.1 pyridoxamine 5'-phosphate oxidase [Aquimarina sp. RZ0]